MTQLKKLKITLLSYAVSDFRFHSGCLEIRWLRLYRKSIPLSSITRLDVVEWVHRFRVAQEPAEEYRWTRVNVYVDPGFAVSLKSKDVDDFLQRVKTGSPDVQIRRLPTIRRSVELGARK